MKLTEHVLFFCRLPERVSLDSTTASRTYYGDKNTTIYAVTNISGPNTQEIYKSRYGEIKKIGKKT